MAGWTWKIYAGTEAAATAAKVVYEERDPSFYGAFYPPRGEPPALYDTFLYFFAVAVREGVTVPSSGELVVQLSSSLSAFFDTYFP